MRPHVCPWWGGYFIDNPLRRLLHRPEKILAPFLSPGMTALDFGCGMGMFAIAMARLVGPGGKVIAADVQPRMLATLEKRARKAGLAERIRGHLCQPDRLGLAEPIDFALAFWSAHESRDLRRLLEEVCACLARGGRFLIVEPRGHVAEREFRDMVQIARQVGFDRLDDAPRVRLSHTAALVK
ncbi:MAG: class I SAM-dependent methyltransferase [Thermoguttaceae bacterium]